MLVKTLNNVTYEPYCKVWPRNVWEILFMLNVRKLNLIVKGLQWI